MAIPISTQTTPEDAVLASFPSRLNAVVIGAEGGIGGAILALLAAAPRTGQVLALSRRGQAAPHANVSNGKIELTDEASIAAAADLARRTFSGPVHLVFVATGMLHGAGIQPEKALRQIDPAAMAQSFAVNAAGPALAIKHFTPLLAKSEKACIAAISARVGSISDNALGGWYAYRASKAALNQLIRCAAIELARKYPEAAVLALHPGTTATPLSAPFQAGVAAEKLFTPAYAANRLLSVIDAAGPADSGKLFAWDGAEIAP